MARKRITKTLGLSASAPASLLAALLATAPGCAGTVSTNTASDTPTRSAAQHLGLGTTATALQVEVLTTSCTANGREDILRVTNRGTLPVALSDIGIKYWADDTSGQTLVPTVQSGGQITTLDGALGCVHEVSGVTASATSFSPACGLDATHQANWEVGIADGDTTMLPPGAAWTDLRVDLALADSSSFVPGTADWYSPCLSSTSYSSDVHFAVYDQDNLVSANGVMTAPSCRPPTTACLVAGTYSLPVTGSSCFPAQTAIPASFCPGIGPSPACCTAPGTECCDSSIVLHEGFACCRTPASTSSIDEAAQVTLTYDVATGWRAAIAVPGVRTLEGFSGPLVANGSTFTARAAGLFGACTAAGLGPSRSDATLTVSCDTGSASLTANCALEQTNDPCIEGCPGTEGLGAGSFQSYAGSAALFAPVPGDAGTGPDAAAGDGGGCTVAEGVAPVASSSAPVPIVGLPGRVTAIAAGDAHTCALMADGSVACWGDDSSAQLGLGNGVLSLSSTPVVVPGVSGATSLAAGGESTCALLAGGAVVCWGSGGGATSPTPLPVAGLGPATSVSVGATHACALLADGTIACWGDDTYGELGDGTTSSSSAPVAVAGLSGVVAVGAGTGSTCALLSDATLACWGRNDLGQLGVGATPSPVSSPTLVATATAPLGGVQQIAVSATESFACASGGSVACWGNDASGQLGDGTTVQSPVPVPVSGVCNVASVAVGTAHACALHADGTVACWGDNSFGELGSATAASGSTAVAVAGLAGVRALAAGSAFTCALLSDGTVSCWGDNGHADLGIGAPAPSPAAADGGAADAGACAAGSLQIATARAFPTPVAQSGLSGATALVAGYDDVCALMPGGSVRCAGNNAFGQLGDGTLVDRSTPVPVTMGLAAATALGDGPSFNCALLPGGSVSCWGYDADGELGDGTTNNSSTPVGVSGLTGAVAVSGGDRDACALLSGGSVECWGDNSRGNLGNGTTNPSPAPALVSNLDRVTAIASGQGFHCALQASGKLRCWGDNTYGELGTGAATGQLCAGSACWTTPVEVTGGREARAVAAGFHDACALLSGGTVECWGDNTYGELGNGTTTSSAAPVAVSNLGGVAAIAAGSAFHCALLSNGTVECWGDNTYGELGNGTTTSSTTPVAVSGLGDVTSIATGAYRACARLSDATVECWGYLADDGGPFPPLAPPTPTLVPSSTIPLPVPGLTDVVSLAAGDGFTCALRTTGEVECLGANGSGQLGNGTGFDYSAPVVVPALEGVVQIGAGPLGGCALRSNGSVRCWGDNTFGQLGNGTTVTSATPVTVADLNDATALAVSAFSACALRANGHVSCWGDNSYGALGDATTGGPDTCMSCDGCAPTPCSTRPVPVSGLRAASALVTGSSDRRDPCALLSDGRGACWGDDTFGELGDGPGAGSEACAFGPCSTTPRLVPGPRTITAIASGSIFNCALLQTGSVECWGDDGEGELGDMTFTSTPSPVPVRGLRGAIAQIAAGDLSACALLADGHVECWGYNADGELGNGSMTSPSPPGRVSNLNHVRSVVIGEIHACALLSTGTVDCWGDNSHGQLGYTP